MWASLGVDRRSGTSRTGTPRHVVDRARTVLGRGVDPAGRLPNTGAKRASSRRASHVHAAAKTRLPATHSIPERLTIGFARRFRNLQRPTCLQRLDTAARAAGQLVIAARRTAGQPGKDVMQQITSRASIPIGCLPATTTSARAAIIPGCDVWPTTDADAEASGTPDEGRRQRVLNLSVLGVVAEATRRVGWAIDGVSDDADREQLYRLLGPRLPLAQRRPGSR